jgi:hypothetical protein
MLRYERYQRACCEAMKPLAEAHLGLREKI